MPRIVLEPLESRIAPALLIAANGLSATYTDVDGDLVTIKASKPILDLGDFTHPASGLGDQLQLLDFSDDGTAADGVNLTITAKPQRGHGDGLVNIGRINATGRVLGSVVVGGDLGVIDAGNTTVNPFAMQSLTVHSLGELGTTTGAPDLISDLAGSVKSISVKGNVRNAFVNITGGLAMTAVDPSLGALTIGGSILGGSVSGSGSVNVTGDIGPVKVGGSMVAGSGASTAQIGSLNGSIGAVTIGGDVIGGPSGFSGYIFASESMGAVSIGGDLRGGGTAGGDGNTGLINTAFGSITSVKIGGSIVGGATIYSGTVAASTNAGTSGKLGAVTVGGSLLGGGAANTGLIFSAGKMGPVTIARDVKGGSGAGSGLVSCTGDIALITIGGSLIGGGGADSGLLKATGSLGPVKIGGDVQGGTDARTGRITADVNIASVAIGGSLIGSAFQQSGTIELGATAGAPSAGPITIGGSVLGGGGLASGSFLTQQSGNETFGAIKVGGDWRGGSGDSSGRLEAGSVASISIGGSVIGGSAYYTGYLGARTFGAVKVSGDLAGGANSQTGSIFADSSIKSLTIGGSLIGGPATDSGLVFANAISTVIIGHDIRGGDASGSSLLQTGYVYGGELGSITVGGSILAGHQAGGGHSSSSGGIGGRNIGSLTVKGSIVGNASVHAQITASGNPAPGLVPGTDLAIKNLVIFGRVEFALIAVGLDFLLEPVDADAQIGSVKVAGDWIASSLLAGVNTSDGRVGDGSDAKLANAQKDDPKAFSKIASITIAGQVLGNASDPSLTYGFGAEEIGSFKANGVALTLQPGRSNDKFGGPSVAGQAVAAGPSLASPAVMSDGFAVHVFEI